jgi:hypothetical protein
LLLNACAPCAQFSDTIRSPDGRIAVEFRLDERVTPRNTIALDGEAVLAESRLGLVTCELDTDAS